MSDNARSVGLSIRRRVSQIYAEIAPIKAVADAWNLDGIDGLLPSDAEVKAAILAFEAVEINPLRLYEEIAEIKSDAVAPPITGQVLIDASMITGLDSLPFAPVSHEHIYIDDIMQLMPVIRSSVMASHMSSVIALFPSSVIDDDAMWATCDGREILRSTPGGDWLRFYGFQFGTGDGTTTANIPNMTGLAPAGFVYKMFVGIYLFGSHKP